jgi:hypothetical protein
MQSYTLKADESKNDGTHSGAKGFEKVMKIKWDAPR